LTDCTWVYTFRIKLVLPRMVCKNSSFIITAMLCTDTSIPWIVASNASRHQGIERSGAVVNGPADEARPGTPESEPIILARFP
ncbi:unnamed protein product, partial [Ilex paraguariensis]